MCNPPLVALVTRQTPHGGRSGAVLVQQNVERSDRRAVHVVPELQASAIGWLVLLAHEPGLVALGAGTGRLDVHVVA